MEVSRRCCLEQYATRKTVCGMATLRETECDARPTFQQDMAVNALLHNTECHAHPMFISSEVASTLLSLIRLLC